MSKCGYVEMYPQGRKMMPCYCFLFRYIIAESEILSFKVKRGCSVCNIFYRRCQDLFFIRDKFPDWKDKNITCEIWMMC